MDIPAANVKDRVPESEWKLRVDLAAAFRLVAHYGWDDIIFTHMSVRLPGPEHHFLINPYNLMFDEITASSLVKIGIDGQAVEETPYVVNPAGFTIHSAIHMAREDAQAVIHLHTAADQAVSAQEDGLLPITQTAMLVQGEIAYHDYEGVATDLDERERLVRDLGAKKAMILRNHGALACGATIAQAFITIYYLERACAAQVMALTAERLYMPPQGSPEKAAAQGGAGLPLVADRLAWPALLRKCDRLDPSFRT